MGLGDYGCGLGGHLTKTICCLLPFAGRHQNGEISVAGSSDHIERIQCLAHGLSDRLEYDSPFSLSQALGYSVQARYLDDRKDSTLAATAGPGRLPIEFEVEGLDVHHLVMTPPDLARTLHSTRDPGDQFRGIEWFRDVIVGPCPETRDQVLDLI